MNIFDLALKNFNTLFEIYKYNNVRSLSIVASMKNDLDAMRAFLSHRSVEDERYESAEKCAKWFYGTFKKDASGFWVEK